MENWALSQLELSQAKENRMEESKGRESSKDPSGEGSWRGARVREGGNITPKTVPGGMTTAAPQSDAPREENGVVWSRSGGKWDSC